MKPRPPLGIPTLIFTALALDLAGTLSLLPGVPAALGGWPVFLVLHLTAALSVALVLFRLFPPPYRRPRRQSALTLFVLAASIPVFGIPGLLIGIVAALYMPRREPPAHLQTVTIPELPFKPLAVSEQPLYGSGGLIGILRNAPDPEKRIQAVMATRQLRDQDAVPILREALRDPEDDVRLLAYSLLDGKEQRINEAIRRLLEELETATGQRAGLLHRHVASQYWELAYLGLASGDVYDHVLQQVLTHCDAALAELGRLHGLLYQRGRVLLRLGRWDEAEAAFREALQRGMGEADILPYLAEIAYLRRHWAGVVDCLRRLDPQVLAEPPLSLVGRFWGVST